jgi:alpha,alpha-trehalase
MLVPPRSLWALLPLLSLSNLVHAQNVTQTGAVSFSPTPVTTTVPEATGGANETVPGQGVYPPLQRKLLTLTPRIEG